MRLAILVAALAMQQCCDGAAWKRGQSRLLVGLYEAVVTPLIAYKQRSSKAVGVEGGCTGKGCCNH